MKPLGFRKSKDEGGASTLLMSVVVSFTILGTAGFLMPKMDLARRMSEKATAADEEENLNRSAIAFFVSRWHQGHIEVDLTKAALTNPDLTQSTVPGYVQPAPTMWGIESSPGGENSMFYKRCPSGHDMDPTPGVLLTPFDASNEDCIAKNFFSKTSVRLVTLDSSRLSAIVEATTALPGKKSQIKTRAAIPVPQGELKRNSVCKITVDGVEAASKGIQSGDTVNFEFHFQPRLVSKVSASIDGTNISLGAKPETTSPLVFNHRFTTANPAGQNFSLKVSAAGGLMPCDLSVEIGVKAPPHSCKWLRRTNGVAYTERMDFEACEIDPKGSLEDSWIWGHRRAIFKDIEVGMEVGTPITSNNPGLSTWSNHGSTCQSSDTCTIRDYGVMTPTYGEDMNSIDCRSLPGGVFIKEGDPSGHWAFTGARLILGMFKTSATSCISQIVIARSPTDGCLPGDAKVRMADGSLRKIEEISTGDMVMNAETKGPVKVGFLTAGQEDLPLVVLGAGGRKIRVTSLHPMVTRDGFKAAKDIRLGDSLLMADKTFREVELIEEDSSQIGMTVWNLILDRKSKGKEGSREPRFIVDDFVVGDWPIQQMIAKGLTP